MAWTRIARAALVHAGDGWYGGRLAAVGFGIRWLLPEAAWRWARVGARGIPFPKLTGD